MLDGLQPKSLSKGKTQIAGGIGCKEDGIFSENPTFICHLHSSLRVTLSSGIAGSTIDNNMKPNFGSLGTQGGGGREKSALSDFSDKCIISNCDRDIERERYK